MKSILLVTVILLACLLPGCAGILTPQQGNEIVAAQDNAVAQLSEDLTDAQARLDQYEQQAATRPADPEIAAKVERESRHVAQDQTAIAALIAAKPLTTAATQAATQPNQQNIIATGTAATALLPEPWKSLGAFGVSAGVPLLWGLFQKKKAAGNDDALKRYADGVQAALKAGQATMTPQGVNIVNAAVPDHAGANAAIDSLTQGLGLPNIPE
jgi:hypothetical protein